MSSSPPTTLSPPLAASGGPARRFGRFELRAPVGRSQRTLLWRAVADGRDWLLAMPRGQRDEPAALAAWHGAAQRLARLVHPSIATPDECALQGRQPYLAYDVGAGLLLPEWQAAHGAVAPADAARWLGDILQALAYVHDAGAVHGDLQSQMLCIGDGGRVRLLGLGAVPGGGPAAADPAQARRDAAEADVLGAGVLLHNLLAQRSAFDEPDLGRVIGWLAPHGRDTLRLPRAMALPEALRAIADRATHPQPRLRYRNARTLQHALEAWRESQGHGQGRIDRLLQRIDEIGHLPALSGASARVARLASTDGGRTHEMAQLLLDDLALGCELLRQANSATVRATQAPGGGAVLTLRRAIVLLGLDRVRLAANALRPWPGALDDAGADALQRLCARVRQAGRAAVAIRPAGFDDEVVFLAVLMQNLGRLLAQYHFPDDAAQIRQLMQPAPPARPGEREQPGLPEADAAAAVLGVDLDAIGAAVARHWGFDAELLALMRRLDPALPVRASARDDELIRATASCANEAVDALELGSPARRAEAIERIAQRYARLLAINSADLRAALLPIAPATTTRPDDTARPPGSPA